LKRAALKKITRINVGPRDAGRTCTSMETLLEVFGCPYRVFYILTGAEFLEEEREMRTILGYPLVPSQGGSLWMGGVTELINRDMIPRSERATG